MAVENVLSYVQQSGVPRCRTPRSFSDGYRRGYHNTPLISLCNLF